MPYGMKGHKEYLKETLTYDQFLKELEDLKAWIGKDPRPRGSWYFSTVNYFEGRR